MKITISGKNIDVTEGLKAAVNEKLGKLEKYFTPDTNVIVTLRVEKERQKIEPEYLCRPAERRHPAAVADGGCGKHLRCAKGPL